MRRVLLVDDHQDVLRRYCESFRPYSKQVDLVTATSDGVLEVLQSKAPDVVIADMHMSGIGGPAFLRQIKDSHPDILRIMVCPKYEISSTYFAVATVHQILAKPVDPRILLNVVERSCRLRDLLTNSMRKKIGGVRHLPPVPDVYLELTRAIARSETSSAEIAGIIAKDPATAAKLLQLVNSACFGALRQITTLEHAVAYVGTDLIRDLSLSIHLFGALERTASQSGFSFHLEQEHSLLTARVAKRLSTKRAEAQNAFTAALLHDIGKLVLAVCIPGDYAKVQQASNKTLRPPHEIELEILGFSHAEAGAYLLALWGLPYPIVEAVAFHHNPGSALEQGLELPTTVSVANALVDEIMRNRPFTMANHLETLGLTHELPRWTALARKELPAAVPEVMVQ